MNLTHHEICYRHFYTRKIQLWYWLIMFLNSSTLVFQWVEKFYSLAQIKDVIWCCKLWNVLLFVLYFVQIFKPRFLVHIFLWMFLRRTWSGWLKVSIRFMYLTYLFNTSLFHFLCMALPGYFQWKDMVQRQFKNLWRKYNFSDLKMLIIISLTKGLYCFGPLLQSQPNRKFWSDHSTDSLSHKNTHTHTNVNISPV